MKIFSVLAVCAYCVAAEKIKIGDLKNLHHGVSGSVFATDDHTLVIENFNYDGAGPDAFFWVGTEGSPSNVADEKTLILDPQGQNYKYRDQSAPVLGRSDDEMITLTLPSNMKVGDLKWISVWCRRFTVDFGNLIFPDNLDLPTSEKSLPHPLVPVDDNAVAEPEPESESEPEPEHDHDHHDHDHHDHDHNRVDAEPSAEPSSSSGLVVSSLVSSLVLLLSSLFL